MNVSTTAIDQLQEDLQALAARAKPTDMPDAERVARAKHVFVKRISLGLAMNLESCIDCGKCDLACKWGVGVSTVKSVTDSECSNCQDCVRSCPVPDTLTLNLGRRRS